SLSGIKCVFVFDNKQCVEEKIDERNKRKIRKQKLKEKIIDIENALDQYKQTGIISDILKTFKCKNKNNSNELVSKLIGVRDFSTLALSDDIQVSLIEEYLLKSKNNILPIYNNDFETIKNMCKAVGFATI